MYYSVKLVKNQDIFLIKIVKGENLNRTLDFVMKLCLVLGTNLVHVVHYSVTEQPGITRGRTSTCHN